MDQAEIAVSGFVISCCQAPGIFEFVEASLDHIAQRLNRWVDGQLELAIALCRYHCCCAAPRPSGPAAGRCRVAGTHGEARSASGSRWSPGAQKDNHRVATACALRKATQAASCSADSTSERASCAPIGMSSTNLRLRHLRTVFGFRRYCAASAATQAFDRCIAARTACLVAALP